MDLNNWEEKKKEYRVYMHIVFILIVILIVLLMDSSEAENAMVCFVPSGLYLNETHIFYQGERDVILRLEFPEHCIGWNISVSNKLFLRSLSDCVEDNKNKSDVYMYGGIELNESAPLGNYKINILFNYTTQQYELRKFNFTYEIELRKIMNINTSEVQDKNALRYILEINLYEDCETAHIDFYVSGDLQLSTEVIESNNLECGVNVFQTKIIKVDSPYRANILGYRVIVQHAGRTIKQEEKNIFLNWTTEEKNEEDYKYNKILISIFILLSIVIIDFIYLKKFKH